jgi:hypothetical protein
VGDIRRTSTPFALAALAKSAICLRYASRCASIGCRSDAYAEFGRPYQQQLIDHFGGGNFHVHGNGRHLLGEMAKLKGCVVAAIGDDGAKVRAMDDLENLKRQVGPITPVISCEAAEFERRLGEGSLIGGVYYSVRPVKTADDANRLMDLVRGYRA